MSVESFHQAYLADENFVKDMSQRPEYGTVSPIRLMAGIYIKEGSSGLSQASYARAHRIDSSTANADKKDYEELTMNASAIYFGETLTAIEDIIIEGYFDQEKFNSVLEFSFTGSFLDPKLFPTPEVEEINRANIDTLTRAAMQDKTFTPFFKNNYHILPQSLRIFLAETRSYHQIETAILPEYTERVKRLIIANQQRKNT